MGDVNDDATPASSQKSTDGERLVIVGRVGLIGQGKTLLTARDARLLAERRKAVLCSNIWIDGSIPLDDWRALPVEDRGYRVQLPVGHDGFDVDELAWLRSTSADMGRGLVLFIDEIGILMPARFWQSFPIDLMFEFSQSRKNRVDVFYTSQDIEDVDSYLRKKTQHVYKVKAWPRPTIDRQERGQRPLFFFETMWSPGQVGKKDKRLGWSFRRYRRSDERTYNTDELVMPARRLGTRDLCARHRKEDAERSCPACQGRTTAEVAGRAASGP